MRQYKQIRYSRYKYTGFQPYIDGNNILKTRLKRCVFYKVADGKGIRIEYLRM
jgi:hypothetical protein